MNYIENVKSYSEGGIRLAESDFKKLVETDTDRYIYLTPDIRFNVHPPDGHDSPLVTSKGVYGIRFAEEYDLVDDLSDGWSTTGRHARDIFTDWFATEIQADSDSTMSLGSSPIPAKASDFNRRRATVQSEAAMRLVCRAARSILQGRLEYHGDFDLEELQDAIDYLEEQHGIEEVT